MWGNIHNDIFLTNAYKDAKLQIYYFILLGGHLVGHLEYLMNDSFVENCNCSFQFIKPQNLNFVHKSIARRFLIDITSLPYCAAMMAAILNFEH